MKGKPTILKLGGSAITDKSKPLTPRINVISRLAKEISKANITPLIIIHGGGSYGHPIALKYHVKDGFKGSRQLIGFVKTHEAMVSLNSIIVDTLIKSGVSAFRMPPSSFMFMKGEDVQVFGEELLLHALKIGLTPVLYGDVILNAERGFTIISGDKIASTLAAKLDVERVIMAVDVDGVYTANPKIDASARLIPRLTLNEIDQVCSRSEGRVMDVTGGMTGKLLELRDVVKLGVNVLIVNALKPDNIYKALKGESVVGTRIIKE